MRRRCQFAALSIVNSAGHQQPDGGRRFMTTTMIAPKILEPSRTGGRSAGEGADCFDLVKTFGSRIFRLAKYITESDADAEDVLVETFLKACADGSGSRADERLRVRL